MLSKKLLIGATTLGLGLSLTLSGCTPATNDTPGTPEPAISSPATEPEDVMVNDASDVAESYEELISGIYDIDPEDWKAIEAYMSERDTPTDEEKAEAVRMLKEAVPAFENIDVEGLTIDEQGQVFGSLAIAGAARPNQGTEITVNIPEEAIMVTGDTAIFKSTDVVLTQNGEVAPNDVTTGSDVTFVKKNGEWLLDARALLDSVTNN
jgi:hypothetical protein